MLRENRMHDAAIGGDPLHPLFAENHPRDAHTPRTEPLNSRRRHTRFSAICVVTCNSGANTPRSINTPSSSLIQIYIYIFIQRSLCGRSNPPARVHTIASSTYNQSRREMKNIINMGWLDGELAGYYDVIIMI